MDLPNTPPGRIADRLQHQAAANTLAGRGNADGYNFPFVQHRTQEQKATARLDEANHAELAE